MGFTKRETNIAKGIAILLLLFHHLFLAGRFEEYGVKFLFLDYAQADHVAVFSKICVGLFAFLSGYGLYLSYSKKDSKNKTSSGKWMLERYVHSFRGFWFILLIAWFILFFIKRDRIGLYFKDSVWVSPLYFFLDFTGLAGIMETPNLIMTYWYMSAVVIFILFVPVFYKSLEKIGPVFTAAWVILIPKILVVDLPNTRHPYVYVAAMLAGMIFAKYDIFTQINNYVSVSKVRRAGISFLFICLTVFCYRLDQHLHYKNFWWIKYGVIAVVIMITIYLLFTKLPLISKAFEFLGIHSANIFMVHNLYRTLYPDKLYCFKYASLIFLVLLGFSLTVSIIIEFIKKKINYNNRIEKLLLNRKRKEETSK